MCQGCSSTHDPIAHDCTLLYCSMSPDMQNTSIDVTNSWHPQVGPLPRRGARLKDPLAVPHPTYAAQTLFSIYVHTDPSFQGYPTSSIFYGREIVPQMHGKRFSHSLTSIALLLFEAALMDTAVDNAHFVTTSDSDVPLYHGAIIYWQLLNERRSRVGEDKTYRELMHRDNVRPRRPPALPR
jgi:hypothetical protein